MSEAPEALCRARKPDAPQQGERCSLLPHANWMPHSWVPWSLSIRWQQENRDALMAGQPMPHPADPLYEPPITNEETR